LSDTRWASLLVDEVLCREQRLLCELEGVRDFWACGDEP
jgi:hypothetical protein